MFNESLITVYQENIEAEKKLTLSALKWVTKSDLSFILCPCR